MNESASHSSSIPSRLTYSCIRCANRKVKCNRQRPCSACVKHSVECVFNPSPPSRKRQKRVKDQVLTERLRHYEVLLQEQGIDPSQLPDTPRSELLPKELHTPSSIESEPSRNDEVNKTQVLHSQGRFKFVDNSLWTRVVEEYHNTEDDLEDSSNDPSDQETEDFGFVFGNLPKSKSGPQHPPPESIHQLFDVYIERIDPLTKVVHVPTLRPAIEKAASSVSAIPRTFEPLLFAIYGAAIMSLKDEECKQKFNQPRKALLSRYTSATKAALSRANFMGTTSLVVLQALVLHLIATRDIYQPRTIWSLTGVAVRIAQGMGLERDGASLGLPPFETEMRRRVWWLLKSHDFRTAELCGLSKFRDLDTGDDSTKWPTNVNDYQLYPGIPSLAAEPTKLTDCVFIALRGEMSYFAGGRIAKFRQQGKGPSQWDLHRRDKGEMDEAIKEIEECLEIKYLRYCDPSQPLHLMAMVMVRLSLNVMRFLSNHPRRWASIEQTPLSERQWIWEVSLKLLEQHNMVLSNPLLKQFAWHAPYFQQWHSFLHILDTLRVNPLIEEAEKAWQLIGNVYDNTPNMIFDTRKPIHVAVGNLCLKAYGDREAALRNRNMSTPKFILQLRQQREVSKAKRQAREKSSRPDVPLSQANAQGPRLETSVVALSDSLESANLQQNTTSALSHAQISDNTEDDPFWVINGFADEASSLDDMMNLDPDFMLTQDYNMDWEQWDAWLADSNLILPLSEGT